MLRSFSPYRICPLGAHIDHQKGRVTGFAIDKGVSIEYEILDSDVVELISTNFDEKVTFQFGDELYLINDWANQIRGVVKYFKKRYELKKGIKGIISGQLPIGGLSSSSAVAIAFINAIATANNLALGANEIIDAVYWSENNFLGLKVGLLDPSCEVLCERDKLLYLDTLTKTYRNITFGNCNIDYEFIIIFSGIERNLVNTSYNVRVDECKTVAYTLKAYDDLDYGKYEDAYLRDISKDLFLEHKEKLPQKFIKRAMHFYNENQRVLDGVNAWANGDIKEFGRLVFESGQSSIEMYEAGSSTLITLFNILKTTSGVLGARFLGGGFNGSCFAIIETDNKKRILKEIKERYVEKFPQYKENFNIYVCNLANGVMN